MRQDPEECLLSFVCSTANNVPRIARRHPPHERAAGRATGHDGAAGPTTPSLPSPPSPPPTRGVQAATGLGYRAGRLVALARQLQARAPAGCGLRQAPYPAAHAALVALPGVGPKVADCACLFSLDHTEAVPVDTHIWQVAQRLWGREGAGVPLPPGRSPQRWRPHRRGLPAHRRRVPRALRALAGYAQNWLFYDHFRGYWGGAARC